MSFILGGSVQKRDKEWWYWQHSIASAEDVHEVWMVVTLHRFSCVSPINFVVTYKDDIQQLK